MEAWTSTERSRRTQIDLPIGLAQFFLFFLMSVLRVFKILMNSLSKI